MQEKRKRLLSFLLGLFLGTAGMILFMGINLQKVMAINAEASLMEMVRDANLLRAGMDDELLKSHDEAIPRYVIQFNSVHRRFLKGNRADAALWKVQRYYDRNPSLAIPAAIEPILAALPPPPASMPRLKSLVGQQAPDFELGLLDGGKMKLSDHKDKNVVILDFWAIWCGPCRRALPIAERVAERFKDQGVVLYAVNEKDTAEEIRAFLKEQGLDVIVALDTDGVVGNKYQQGIPTMVIVGRNGIIQAYHVGLSPEDEITENVKAALGTENAE